MSSLVVFSNDLRISDNPSLTQALKGDEKIFSALYMTKNYFTLPMVGQTCGG